MFRHTTFRFCLDPTVEQHKRWPVMLGRAVRVQSMPADGKAGLTHRKTDASVDVPWTGFDLINVFNAWKKTEAAGRVFAVDTDG